MNNGAFGENFPYSNFHDLNMDWIIKIAKDFLDQYTHIQEIIEEGEQDIANLTEEELQALTDKKNELEALLDQWYTTHSNDIAVQLANAITSFNNSAEEKARITIASIPDDYSTFYTQAVKAHGWAFVADSDYSAYPEYMDLNVPVKPNEILGYGRSMILLGLQHYPDKFINGFSLINLCPRFNDMSGGMQIATDWITGELATRTSTGNPSSLTWTEWAYSGKHSTDYIKTTSGTANSVINERGAIISNQYTTNYILTDYIPVNYGDEITIGYVRGSSNLPGGVVFDEDHNYLFPLGFDKDYDGEFSIVINDYRAKYIRVNVAPPSLFNPKDNYIYVEPVDYPVKIYDVFINKTINYNQITNNWFNSLFECAEYINNNDITNATIHVLYGTYDIVTEMGSSFFESYDGSDRYAGAKFGNNCRWIFSEGANIICNYNGNNTNVAESFSPVVIKDSCTIENMTIVVTNCQYCVHDDYVTRSTDVHIEYINCAMNHNANTLIAETLSCIGGGTLPFEFILIEGGYYKSAYQYPITYHSLWSNWPTPSQSQIVMKDVFFSNGSIAFNDAPYDTNNVDVTITGCSFTSAIGGNHTSPKFIIREWNNVIR